MSQSAVKLVLYLRRKHGLSPAEFEDHYENSHVPLVERLFPSCMQRYTRNYIQRQGAIEGRPGGTDEPICDVLTEVWFATEADYTEFQRRLGDPEIQEDLFADEEKFIDRPTITFYIVKERISEY